MYLLNSILGKENKIKPKVNSLFMPNKLFFSGFDYNVPQKKLLSSMELKVLVQKVFVYFKSQRIQKKKNLGNRIFFTNTFLAVQKKKLRQVKKKRDWFVIKL